MLQLIRSLIMVNASLLMLLLSVHTKHVIDNKTLPHSAESFRLFSLSEPKRDNSAYSVDFADPIEERQFSASQFSELEDEESEPKPKKSFFSRIIPTIQSSLSSLTSSFSSEPEVVDFTLPTPTSPIALPPFNAAPNFNPGPSFNRRPPIPFLPQIGPTMGHPTNFNLPQMASMPPIFSMPKIRYRLPKKSKRKPKKRKRERERRKRKRPEEDEELRDFEEEEDDEEEEFEDEEDIVIDYDDLEDEEDNEADASYAKERKFKLMKKSRRRPPKESALESEVTYKLVRKPQKKKKVRIVNT